MLEFVRIRFYIINIINRSNRTCRSLCLVLLILFIMAATGAVDPVTNGVYAAASVTNGLQATAHIANDTQATVLIKNDPYAAGLGQSEAGAKTQIAKGSEAAYPVTKGSYAIGLGKLEAGAVAPITNNPYAVGLDQTDADAIAPVTNNPHTAGLDRAEASANPPANRDFRVVGYYSGDLFDEPVSRLQTDKLTHLIYAFLIPRADGGLEPIENEAKLRSVVEKAHGDGAKVIIALGGWSYKDIPLAATFETVASSDTLRSKLVQNVRAFLDEYALDGIEIDWEHPYAGNIVHYERFVLDLKAAMDEDGRSLTAVLNGAWSTTAGPEVSTVLTDACLDSFEFMNIMAYDMGTQEHSPLWFAKTSLDYWLKRGVPAEKLVLGIPLYARPSWLQYRNLIDVDIENAYRDFSATEPLPSYYNGINTMLEKLWIALRGAGGVMLFDVNEDADTPNFSIVYRIGKTLSRVEEWSNEQIRSNILVFLDREELVFLPEDGLGMPFIDENGRTLMPFRKPLEAIDAHVSYDEQTRTATASKAGITVSVPIGERFILVNGDRIEIDTQAMIINGRTYLPLRAVFSAFGYSIEWHGDSRSVLVKNIDMEM